MPAGPVKLPALPPSVKVGPVTFCQVGATVTVSPGSSTPLPAASTSSAVAVAATASTVTTKASLAVSAPSLTVTVIVLVPARLDVGVTMTVRLAPLPPKTMFPSGTRVGLDEDPDTTRLPTGVSGSPTMNPIGPTATLIGVV